MAKNEASRKPKKSARRERKSTAKPPRKPSSRPEFEPLEISTHRDLAKYASEINRRLNKNPELARLVLVNPALAFKEVGASMSPEIIHHILHTIQHSTSARQRQDALEEELHKELDEKPQPHNPEWASKFLFEKLELDPIDTRGLTPAYISALTEESLKRLQSLRPTGRRRPRVEIGGRRPSHMRVQLKEHRTAARRLDLNAELPKLKRARSKPKSITFEELYFYKDRHPLVRKVLEFGLLQLRTFPVATADRFRRIRDGEERNLFHSWITSVRFPVED